MLGQKGQYSSFAILLFYSCACKLENHSSTTKQGHLQVFNIHIQLKIYTSTIPF
jgi:hypothetical protein